MKNKLTNIVLFNLKDNHFENIEESLSKKLDINNIQTYYPVYTQFYNFENDNYSITKKMFLSKYTLHKINDEIEEKNKDSYIKKIFTCDIRNNYNNSISQKNIFFKLNSIYDNLQLIQNEYNSTHNHLSNIYNHLTNKKINDINNTAYIDAFSYFLGSRLVEYGYCPTFPLYYGTFSGIANNFKFDITEDYEDILQQSWCNPDKLNLTFEENTNFDKMLSEITDDSDNNLNNNDIEKLLNYQDDSFPNEIINEEDLEKILNNNSNNNSESEIKQEQEDNSNNNSESEIEQEQEDNSNNNSESEIKQEQEDNSNNNSDNNSDNNSENSSEINIDIQDNENENIINEIEVDLNIDDISDNEDNWTDIDSETDSDSSLKSKCRKKIYNKDNIINLDDIDIEDLESCSDISINDIEKYSKFKYCNLSNHPVQVICIDSYNDTLDNLIDNGYKISDTEWKSILFQICYGLAIFQKYFSFIHNDLHSSNIMFEETEKKYLYFSYNSKYFRIPTFNKITKIIDFGRATFKVKNKVYFSDVFKKNGDAEGQYNYPYNNISDCKIKPNTSFDLCRLATTISDHFEKDSELYKLLELWTTDKYGNILLYENDDFNLYKNIAKNVFSAVPKNQFNKMIFKEFIVNREDIPKEEYIFYY